MERLLSRAWVCPVLLVILGGTLSARAVDPIDFLESLKDDDDSSLGHHKESSSTEYPNGVNVIPGEPEVNYPVYSSIPKSSFSCIGRPVGFYADTELRCQVWHICDEDRRQQSFLCTNGTVYSQDKRVCDWWYNVNCDQNEVMRNYLQNYDLYKGPPPKSDSDQEQDGDKSNNNKNKESSKNDDRNDFDYQPTTTTKSYNKDPFSQFPSSRKTAESQQRQRFDNNNNNDQQYSKPTNSYNEPFPTRESSFSNNNDFPTPRRQPPPPPPTRPSTTSTTTYRPPTTYNTPPPPAALQGSSFPPKPNQHQRSHHHQQPQSQQQPQQQQKQSQQTTTPPSRLQPSIKTTNTGGKRIVEIRVPISQIPPEILAKYGKRIPENILKEIFLNFTRNQQQQLQQEAIGSGKPSNPTGAAGNSRSPPPTAPIPQNQNRQSSSRSTPPPPPPPSKKPVDFGNNANNNKPTSFQSNSQPPPPPPPPSDSHSGKFRHSTPRKVDNVKFATPTRELLQEYEDERQQVGESQNPIYSLQQLFSSQHSRTSSRAKAPPPNEVAQLKESFNFEDTTTTAAPYQDFTRSQPREYTRSQPREYTRTQPQEFSRTQPEEFSRTQPEDFSRSKPQEFTRSKPQEFTRSKPQEFTRSKPQEFSRTQPEEFFPTQPQEFSRSEPQEFTRSQPRRRTQGPNSLQSRTTTTTEEPNLITDRYFPVSSQEEKKQAEIKRIFLVAKQGIKVLPPIPVLSGLAAVEVPTARRAPPPLPTVPVTQRPKVFRTTAIPDFSRIPPAPKVSIPDDYFVQNERFEEAESRYPRPSIPPTYTEPQFHTRPYSRPTTTSIPTTTTTTTVAPPPPTTSYYQEPQEFRRNKPSKPQFQQNKKKPLPPPEDKKQQHDDTSSDYDDGTHQDRTNTDELELLRLAQEYIELTGQDFGVRKTPRNA